METRRKICTRSKEEDDDSVPAGAASPAEDGEVLPAGQEPAQPSGGSPTSGGCAPELRTPASPSCTMPRPPNK
ncbi:unnamed protein product [Lampetra fluviatilis]